MDMVVVAYLWWRTHMVANPRKLAGSGGGGKRGVTDLGQPGSRATPHTVGRTHLDLVAVASPWT
eukprot:4948555-Prymnesium_polylepis.1